MCAKYYILYSKVPQVHSKRQCYFIYAFLFNFRLIEFPVIKLQLGLFFEYLE